tara:strand:+ start:282 stop:497 length:216 start_codon:yes stop_codon:yes gene_type:complete
MENIEYKNHWISTGYSYSGKTKHYLIWTKDFTDVFCETFRSIKKAKEYINYIKHPDLKAIDAIDITIKKLL